MTKCAPIIAGGTGDISFPACHCRDAARARVAGALAGGAGSMESQLVPPRGFAFETIDFSGVRGKGFKTLVLPSLRLLGFLAGDPVVRRVRPDVVGLGGYITFPAGMMSVLLGKPLVLHEQNFGGGMANRIPAGGRSRSAPSPTC